MNELNRQVHIDNTPDYVQDIESAFAASVYFEAVDLSVKEFGSAQNFNVVKAIIRILQRDNGTTNAGQNQT